MARTGRSRFAAASSWTGCAAYIQWRPVISATARRSWPLASKRQPEGNAAMRALAGVRSELSGTKQTHYYQWHRSLFPFVAADFSRLAPSGRPCGPIVPMSAPVDRRCWRGIRRARALSFISSGCRSASFLQARSTGGGTRYMPRPRPAGLPRLLLALLKVAANWQVALRARCVDPESAAAAARLIVESMKRMNFKRRQSKTAQEMQFHIAEQGLPGNFVGNCAGDNALKRLQRSVPLRIQSPLPSLLWSRRQHASSGLSR